MKVSTNAMKLLEARYLIKDENGKIIETPEQMCERVAYAAAEGDDELKEKFTKALNEMRFLPNSPALMSLGLGTNHTYSACFVDEVPDSMDGIFDSIKNAALITKAGGGIGFGFSKIRPRGSSVGKLVGTASGPVSFMRVFDSAIDAIKQSSRRRGACMGLLEVWHPDIEEFITAKSTDGDISNFNISVGITNDFMHAVEENSDWDLVFNGKVYKTLRARDLWNTLVEHAWKNGDPGVVFVDKIDALNPTPAIGPMRLVNPCWSGDTVVWTTAGPKTFEELTAAGEDVEVVSLDGDKYVNKMMRNIGMTGVQPIWEIVVETLRGEFATLHATGNHRLFLKNMSKIEVQDLWKGLTLVSAKTCAGIFHRVVSVKKTNIVAPVYNGEVEDTHSYFVQCGSGQWILSHNCGEQNLLPDENCTLGSINLMKHVDEQGIAWDKLEDTIELAVRFLDGVVSINKFPVEKITAANVRNRKIGLGIMGWADLLYSLSIPYGSDESIKLADTLMEFITYHAFNASYNLSQEVGSFEAYDGSIYPMGLMPLPDIKSGKLDWKRLIEKTSVGLRNANVTTIAPTGSISFIAGTSGGIEPCFALALTKTVMDGTKFIETNSVLAKNLEKDNLKLPDSVAITGTLHDTSLPDEYKRIFVTAHDVTPKQHVRMQAAFQKWTTAATSKTINMPESATPEDVDRAYKLAYELGCKGVTVYRDGSRAGQVLTTGTKAAAAPVGEVPRSRPIVTTGTTERVALGCGRNLYVTINEDEHGLCEVFLTTGKSGGCISSYSEAIGRLVSLSLRSGQRVEDIIEQLRGIRCPAPAWSNGTPTLSCADAIGKALEHHLGGTLVKVSSGDAPECPECGALLKFGEGCMSCPSCGYSKCS